MRTTHQGLYRDIPQTEILHISDNQKTAKSY